MKSRKELNELVSIKNKKKLKKIWDWSRFFVNLTKNKKILKKQREGGGLERERKVWGSGPMQEWEKNSIISWRWLRSENFTIGYP